MPYLHIAPLADGYDPVEGGKTCGDEKISLRAMEQLWQRRNGCGPQPHPAPAPKYKQCRAWDCTGAPLVSCHVDGGGRWPGQASRRGDLQGCDGPPQRFPIADAVWEFFDSVSGPPAERR